MHLRSACCTCVYSEMCHPSMFNRPVVNICFFVFCFVLVLDSMSLMVFVLHTLMNKLQLCTFNVRGIHNPIKRRNIFTCLKNDGIDIVMLQETHPDDKEHRNLQQGAFGQAYFSSFTTRSGGVALLIKKNCHSKYLIVLQIKGAIML